MKIKFLYIILVVILSASILFLGYMIYLQDNQLELLNNQYSILNKSIIKSNEYIQNETAIISRVIGDAIPVIIPEEYENKFINLQQKINNYSSASNLYQIISDYELFVKTTPPWIQNEKLDALLIIQDQLDYFSIIREYEKTKNLNTVILKLENFIKMNYNSGIIDEVTKDYNSYLNQYNMIIQNEQDKLITKGNTYLNNANVKLEDIDSLINDLSVFSGESPADDMVDKLKIFSIDIKNKEFESDHNINYQKFKADALNGNFDLNIYSQLLQDIINLKILNYDKYTNEEIEINEYYSRYQILQTLGKINVQLDADNKDLLENSNILLSQVASQLSTIYYNMTLFNYVNKSDIESKLSILKGKFNTFKKLSIKAGQKEQIDSIRAYNKWALETIKDIKNNLLDLNEGISAFSSKEKKVEAVEKKQSFILQLSRINNQILYLPVSNLFNQVYNEIWATLEKDDQFQVTNQALNIEKKGLYE